MARLWPSVLPEWVRADPRRSAEVRVYERLAGVLGDAWSVFYSRPWWGIGPRGGEIDGEADFIVAHPDRGILFIEVKGGRVAYDATTSRWTSTDRNKITSVIKDPVQQAVACKHQYIERLRRLDGWPHGYVRFRHGVILTDCSEPDPDVLALAGHEKVLFCFASRFDGDLDGWVSQRLAAHEPKGQAAEIAPGEGGIQLLTRLVAEPVKLRVPLRRLVDSDMARFEQLLTGQQLHALSVLEALPRLVVEGGAGTGKTVLAAEMAARLADEGDSVCLLCYNDPLAAHLQRALQGRQSVLVGTFHSICGLLINEAGIDAGPVGPSFYEDILPVRAGEALARMPGRRWDAVIVDEGQDFREHWWPVVRDMVHDGKDGVLRVFLDTNQALYPAPADLAEKLDAKQIPLRYNLRNTRAIARISEPLYQGPAILPVGPDGESPVVQELSIAAAQTRAAERTHDLIRGESINPHDIAVLCPSELIAKRVRAELERMRIRVGNATARTANAVTVDTIRRFKGLEAAVILLVVDRACASSRELGYVGVTRAQSRLIVLGEHAGTLLGEALSRQQPAAAR